MQVGIVDLDLPLTTIAFFEDMVHIEEKLVPFLTRNILKETLEHIMNQKKLDSGFSGHLHWASTVCRLTSGPWISS